MASQYNNADSSLQQVNKLFITLNGEDKKKFNKHFTMIIENTIKLMKESDPLFNDVFRKIVYCGSYFDDLKVHKPHEFDLDIVIKLPYDYKKIQFSTNCEHGYLKIIIPNQSEINNKHLKWNLYKTVDKWIVNSHLSKKAVFQWMQGVVTKAVNKFNEQIKIGSNTYKVKLKASNPALTLMCQCINDEEIWFDVDLVPVIEFNTSMWPPLPFRKNTAKTQESWYVVPKSKNKLLNNVADTDFHWRPSFHVQEKRIINNINHLKPALRLLKKLRDTQDFQIASYYLKTIFLWEIENQNELFWKHSLSYVFMHMLTTFKQHMENKKIPFYWHKDNNLVSIINENHLAHIARQINKMIDNINRIVETDKHVITGYILPQQELTLKALL